MICLLVSSCTSDVRRLLRDCGSLEAHRVFHQISGPSRGCSRKFPETCITVGTNIDQTVDAGGLILNSKRRL